MQVTVIGSGTAVPSVERGSPCILLETDGQKILLDTGPGTLRQLLRTGTSPHEIGLIFFSHFHIDHIADMLPFIFASKYNPGKPRTADLTIVGPLGIKELYSRLAQTYGPWVVPELFSIQWLEAAKSLLTWQSITIHTIPVKHIQGSIAIRIEDRTGKSVVYSGDTEYCDNMVSIAQQADLLILECSFPEELPCAGHLVPSFAGRIARESDCRLLLLTHFYPPCDCSDLLTPLRQQFSGEVLMAEDFLSLTI